MWTFVQKTGAILLDGHLLEHGYSGFGGAKNEAEMDHLFYAGPIPRGRWVIVGPPEDTEEHGPYVLRLSPLEGTNTWGRSGFLIHGDSRHHPGAASHGCIVASHDGRKTMWNSGDRELLVVPELAEAV